MSGENTGGVSVLSLLGVVFVTLKLCGVIDWSWWWVTAPFWAPVAIAVAILAALAVLAFVVFAWERLTQQ